METFERKIYFIELAGARRLFEWFDTLDSRNLQLAVDAKLAQLRSGNLGDFKPVGGGVYELRIHKGPGMRIYFGFIDQRKIVIISGGTKRSQASDIKRFRTIWKEFRNETTKI